MAKIGEKSKSHSMQKDINEVEDMWPPQQPQTQSQISAIVNRDIHSHLKARPCIESSPVSGAQWHSRPLRRMLFKLGLQLRRQLWASPV
ncbi:hypothetical protein CDAR_588251 [Caerostris darwini]|uniref:Uncharacterized protein n=1 Tax=Caerostris darwini TaxID=1538125 RepID=A0AAV4S787_9ARAC|nr:hypothetical protein CDAR_588251 [Caerostris darwini]